MSRPDPTTLRHRQQTVWQIVVPLVVSIVLIIGGVILAVIFTSTPTANQFRVWADISTILLIMPVIILAIAALIVLILMMLGVNWLTNKIPLASTLTLIYFLRAQIKIEQLTQAITKPFIQIESGLSGGKRFFQRLKTHSTIGKSDGK